MLSKKNVYLLISLICCGLFIVLAWNIYNAHDTHGPIHTLDLQAEQWIAKNVPRTLDEPMLFITYLANTEVLIASLAALFLILILIHEEILASLFVFGLVVGLALSTYFKDLIHRPRPTDMLAQFNNLGQAFPSGHAIAAMVFYGFLGFCLVYIARSRWQKIVITLLSIALISLISFSRLYLNVHWLSDIVGGLLLGGFILSLLIYFFYASKNYSYAFGMPHGVKLLLIFLVITSLSFFISYYFVTHTVEFRSIVTTSHNK